MTESFAGQVALVTGGGSGIGAATALAFGKAGASVVVADLRADQAALTAEAIVAAGGRALSVAGDVSDAAQARDMIKAGADHYGRIDIAANIAGVELESRVAGDHRAAGIDPAVFDRVIAVNLRGVWLCMKYEIEQMLSQRGGAIINCASAAGLIGGAGLTAYTASKHGVLGLTKAAGIDYARDGIRINAVCPGGVMTPMASNIMANEQYLKLAQQAHPIGRMAEPGEIAAAIVFLASAQASFIVGAALAVDGGWVAQ
jgi:NAD(P)-dependent dehydrogenase (short-subunit alcohol dehydrogenase family)